MLDLALVFWLLLLDEIQRRRPNINGVRQELTQLFLGLFPGDRRARVVQRRLDSKDIDLVLNRFQETKIVNRDQGEGIPAIAANNDSFTSKLNATGSCPKALLMTVRLRSTFGARTGNNGHSLTISKS